MKKSSAGTLVRSIAAVSVFGCGFAVTTASSTSPAKRQPTDQQAAPVEQSTAASSCTPPGTVIITDPAGDQRDAPLHPDMDILSLSVAEPYASDASGNPVSEITFTIKVSDLSSISADGRWQVEWGSSPTRFVNMIADNGNITYNYGRIVAPGNNVNEGPLDCGSYDQAAGTITLTVSTSKVGAIVGGTLSQIIARTRYLLYIPGPFVVTEDFTSSASYTLQGNLSCSVTTPMFCQPTTTTLPPACLPPGNIMVTDRANDQDVISGGTPLPQQDILSLAIAEPYATDSKGALVSEITFTLKVSSLAALPPNASWYVFFNYGDFVDMTTDASANVSFNYGHINFVGGYVFDGPLDCGSYDSAAGTITLTISSLKIGLAPEQKLVAVYAETFNDDPATNTPLTRVDYTFDKQFDYKLQGNFTCSAQQPNLCPPTPYTTNPDAYPPPGITERTTHASIPSYFGNEPDGNTYGMKVSGNDRYVLYGSYATNIVVNGYGNVFIYDRQTGKTELISVAFDGTPAGGSPAAISSDGRYVVFSSSATNIVTQQTDENLVKTFLRDRQTAQTELIAISSNGEPANDSAYGSTVSADGRYVVFQSGASNLVAGYTTGIGAIFLRDRVSATTTLVSTASDGTPANALSNAPAITPDGHYIAFVSSATNLAPNDTGAKTDIYVHDRVSGTTQRVSTSISGTDGNDDSSDPSISADGRFVTFISKATNLVPNGDPAVDPSAGVTFLYVPYAFIADRTNGKIEKILGWDAQRPNGQFSSPRISGDGRYVAFGFNLLPFSSDPNVVPEQDMAVADAFVYDRWTGQQERASIPTSGNTRGYDIIGNPDFSADARAVVFPSTDKLLVPDKTTTINDGFARTRVPGVGIVDLSGTRNGSTLSVTGRARLGGQIVSSATNSANNAAVASIGAALSDASIAYRPEEGDLYIRIGLTNVPRTETDTNPNEVLIGSPGVIYVLYLHAGNQDYQVRIDPPAVRDAFELYSCTLGVCTMAKSIHGGFATGGKDIRFSIRLRDLGVSEGVSLTGLRVESSASPDTEVGPGAPYDSVALPDTTIPLSRVSFGFASPGTPPDQVVFSPATTPTRGTFGTTLDLNSVAPCATQLFAQVCVGSECGTSSEPVDLGTTCPLIPTSVVSRKSHGSAGSFDLNLPLSGAPGIECRSGGASGDHNLVFSFLNTLNAVGSVTATADTSSGTVPVTVLNTSGIGTDTHQYIVNLSGVPNAAHLNVTLNRVTDSAGNISDVSAPMDVLLGDVNGDGQVDSSDLLKVKQQTLQPVTDNPGTSNFREDVNTDGSIDSSDLIIIKRQTLTGLP